MKISTNTLSINTKIFTMLLHSATISRLSLVLLIISALKLQLPCILFTLFCRIVTVFLYAYVFRSIFSDVIVTYYFKNEKRINAFDSV